MGSAQSMAHERNCICITAVWSVFTGGSNLPRGNDEISKGHSNPLLRCQASSATPKGKRTLKRKDSGEIRLEQLESLKAESKEPEDLLRIMNTFAQQADDDAALFSRTLQKVLKILGRGAGGTIVAVLHEDVLEQELRYNYLDKGIHTELFRSISKDIHADADRFLIMMDALTAHSDSDRWEKDELTELIRKIPEVEPFASRLLGQPKDGAILMGHRGSIKGVALHLKYPSLKFQLLKDDDKSAGTRHASALGFAEWLGHHNLPYAGVVFARSDGGGAHAFIPREQRPDVVSFKTLEIPTNGQMVSLLKPKVMKEARVYEKVQPMLIRRGKLGERVVTVLGGRVTADRVIENDESVVIRSSAAEQEEYVLPLKRAKAIYQFPGIELDKVSADDWHEALWLSQHTTDLMALGFNLHKPAPNERRFVYKLTEEDVQLVPAARFSTTFGAVQRIKAGDLIAMQWPEPRAKSMYLISALVLKAYRKVSAEELLVNSDT